MSDKYICRFDYSPHGYWVRLPECANGKMLPCTKDHVSKFFNDNQYKNSKAASKRWRNAYLKKHDCLHFLKQRAHLGRPHINSPRNTSGAIGVTLTVDYRELADGNIAEYYGYKAQWSTRKNKKHYQKKKAYSVNIHGYEGAFLWACRVRYENKGVIIITDQSLIPCYPDVPYLIKES